MSRLRTDLFRLLHVVALIGALPAAAHADVLQIGTTGAVWVAGGPAAQASAADPLQAAPSALLGPVTEVALAAGPSQWQARVAELSVKYDVSPSLIEALVWQESRWQPNAESRVGARGFTQLMPGTARDLGVDPRDPNANLEGGVRYLRMQLDAFDGNLENALAAYNAGPKRVKDAGGIPRIRETQGYVGAIIGRLNQDIWR